MRQYYVIFPFDYTMYSPVFALAHAQPAGLCGLDSNPNGGYKNPASPMGLRDFWHAVRDSNP